MQKGPGRFELILNLPEVIALFFTMVALFTGLLFFGYRVGYMKSANAASAQPRPAAPAQESPQVDQQTPAPPVEPELRLENSPPELSHPGEGARRSCKADSYLSLLQKTIRAHHRPGERVVEWAVAQWDKTHSTETDWNGINRSGQETSPAEPSLASETAAGDPQGREPEAADCSAPVDPRAARSFAC